MDTLAIIKRIEMRIAEIGMSKAEFYKQSGISSASFSQWNTGLYNPSKKKLECAAACLNVSYEYLVNGEETKKAPATNGERKKKLRSVARLESADITPELDENIADYIDYLLSKKDRGE